MDATLYYIMHFNQLASSYIVWHYTIVAISPMDYYETNMYDKALGSC